MTYAQMRIDAKNEGFVEGKAEGRAEGRTEGRAEGMIEALIGLAKDRLISVHDASLQAHMSEAEFAALIERS